jgi:uncharacterized protein (DUF488 family)
MAKKELFTIGYEGLSPRAFLNNLKAHNVDVVIDVREVPRSRKRGFSKSQLDARLKRAGISYVHFKNLGSPAPARKKYKSDRDFAAFARSYAEVLKNESDTLNELYSLAGEKGCCLLCYEADAATCHRSLVGTAVAKLDGGEFTVIHL